MSTMSRHEARVLLDEVSEIQSTTRARLHAHGWQWMVVWSVAFFGAALTALVPAWQEFAGPYQLYPALGLAFGAALAGIITGMMVQAKK